MTRMILVRLHQAAVADHVSGQDGSKPTLHNPSGANVDQKVSGLVAIRPAKSLSRLPLPVCRLRVNRAGSESSEIGPLNPT